jgi:hypothetical protein
MRNFVSEMGKIKSRSVTGLSMQSQKRVAKAVRRAKMMGVMPVLRKATNNELYESDVSISTELQRMRHSLSFTSLRARFTERIGTKNERLHIR